MTDHGSRVRARLEAQPRKVPLATLFAGDRASPQLLRAFASACFAVERAHLVGIVHRDLRPTTILVGEVFDVEVVGWDSAMIVDEPSPLPPVQSAYAAPELATGHIDARSDVFSLGCILADMLERGIAPELDVLCTLAAAPDPVHRVPTARMLGERVLRFLEGERDWVLRAELAAVHIARGVNALDAGRNDLVAAEAAQALRLEPTSLPAAELLLAAEGPLPPEVQQRVAVDLDDGLRDTARTAIWAYVGYILFAPAFLWLASGHGGYAIVLLVLVTINIGLLGVHAYTKRRLAEWPFVIANAALIALIARVASPFLLAPGIAAVTVAALGMSPTYLRARMVVLAVIALSAAVLAPWVAEELGWLSPTVAAVKESLVFTAPAMRLREGAQIVLVAFYVPTLLAASGMLAYSIVKRERQLRYRTYLQLWQMRQNQLTM